MSKHGLSRLQAGMFLNLMLFLASSATALLYYQVEGRRLQLMVIGQLLLLVMSAGVGWQRLFVGVKESLSRRFRLESLLTVSFVVCLLDGLLCLKNQRLPFASVFSLQMLMAQWAEYQRRQTEMSQLDTLRKASDLTAVVKTPNYYKKSPAYQTAEGHPEDFMDHYQQETGPERLLTRYCQGVIVVGVVLALVCAIFSALPLASGCMPQRCWRQCLPVCLCAFSGRRPSWKEECTSWAQCFAAGEVCRILKSRDTTLYIIRTYSRKTM